MLHSVLKHVIYLVLRVHKSSLAGGYANTQNVRNNLLPKGRTIALSVLIKFFRINYSSPFFSKCSPYGLYYYDYLSCWL